MPCGALRRALERGRFAAKRGADDLLRGLLLAEQRCAACRAPFVAPSSRRLSAARALCPACLAALPRRAAGYCPLCGEPAASAAAPSVPCAACLKEAPPWEGFRFHGIYEGLLRLLILRIKYRADAPAAQALGRLLPPLCRELPPCDVLTPMPQHSARLRLRGYNQCLELGRPAAESLGIPLAGELLRRDLPTRPQTQKRRAERRADLSASFAAHPAARGLRILLLDDTMTTGTSLRYAARCLLAAGAGAVRALVLARTALR